MKRQKRMSLKMRALLWFAKRHYLPEMPSKPKPNMRYRITPSGCVCAEGSPYHSVFKLGTENSLLIFFNGGGYSWNEYTAQRPINLWAEGDDCYYFDNVEPLTDMISGAGLLSAKDSNFFRNWNTVTIGYSSGDFHLGSGDFKYKDLDGADAVLHHHGYKNYRAVIETVKKSVPNPDRIVISGCSAGAFAVAGLSGDLVDMFQQCRNITCCVDGGLLICKDWKDIAQNVWQCPEHIATNIHSDNLVFDLLTALHSKHGDKVKILFISSTRDADLSKFQGGIDCRGMVYSNTNGDSYYRILRDTCLQLKNEIHSIGIFIFDIPARGKQKKANLTQHTILMFGNVKKNLGKTSLMDWLKNAINGEITCEGIELLNR